jgi:hypothetical protein
MLIEFEAVDTLRVVLDRPGQLHGVDAAVRGEQLDAVRRALGVDPVSQQLGDQRAHCRAGRAERVVLRFGVLVAGGDPSVADSHGRDCIANPQARDVAAYHGIRYNFPCLNAAGSQSVSRTIVHETHLTAGVSLGRCAAVGEWD